MTVESQLMQPERVDETPPAQPEPQPAPQPAPVDEEAALEAEIAELEKTAIQVPDGAALVELARVKDQLERLKVAVRTERGKKSEIRQEADAAKAQAAQLAQWVEQAKPWIESARALAESRGQQPQQPQQPAPQDDPEMLELAKTLDLYGDDGKHSAAKAKAIADFFDKRAGRVSQEQFAPYAQRDARTQSTYNLAQAKATVYEGSRADPAILDELWARMGPQATANEDMAKWLVMVARGFKTVPAGQQQPQGQGQSQRDAQGRFVQPQQLPDPLYTEKAGGRVDLSPTNLSDPEKKIARELYGSKEDPSGIAAYIKEANTMPKGWGKGR